jgi:hypothetical protein
MFQLNRDYSAGLDNPLVMALLPQKISLFSYVAMSQQ